MSDRTYEKFGHRSFVTMHGLDVAGTNAAIAAVNSALMRVPFRSKVVSATVVSETGGTGAGPSLLLQYSLAGTGSWTSFGTAALGTDADGTGRAFSVTTTSLSAGDHLRVAIAAGTIASTHDDVAVSIAFEELYN